MEHTNEEEEWEDVLSPELEDKLDELWAIIKRHDAVCTCVDCSEFEELVGR